jgi:cytochrome c oxidase subunit 2
VTFMVAWGVLALLTTGCGSSTHQSGGTATASPVAHGRTLYTQYGCAACHSLDGSRMTGPTWKGLAGSRVHLGSGRTVLADNAYLSRHITEPQAFTVAGYPGEVMAEAIAPFELRKHPGEVSALVAFIDSLR